ncbi:cytochrome P450 [Daedaleopsis nitida]|nr:cytochrome P450 [Daedaleopsis nitida]
MILYSAVQKRAQTEIDRVVGINRLPDYVAELPYISAVLKEVLRWHPPGPTGCVAISIPHMLRQDDIHNGYYVPAGSMVLAYTVWELLHDPHTVYPDPMAFKPERFLRDGIFDCSLNYTFGIGRRMCPGKLVAEDSSLWLLIAQFLATFTVSLPEGADPPPAEFTSEAIS